MIERGYTWTEEYRRITEANHVCRMKDKPARQNYIAEIAMIRGNEAAIQLMDDIKIQCGVLNGTND